LRNGRNRAKRAPHIKTSLYPQSPLTRILGAMRSNYLFTSESVSEGHPDKVADQISDAVVDLFIARDAEARVACETLVTTNRIVLAGEVRGPTEVLDGLEDKVRAAVKDIGYEQEGFHWKHAEYACHLHPQSAHIAQGVDAAEGKDEGAVKARAEALLKQVKGGADFAALAKKESEDDQSKAQGGDLDASYKAYGELFESAEFGGFRPEDQRQALKLMVHAKSAPSQATPAMIDAHVSGHGLPKWIIT